MAASFPPLLYTTSLMTIFRENMMKRMKLRKSMHQPMLKSLQDLWDTTSVSLSITVMMRMGNLILRSRTPVVRPLVMVVSSGSRLVVSSSMALLTGFTTRVEEDV
ncbi:unnamed protein product [Microthlaspi erraticum]|uniref:Uncharacterized protein n=1 Tax=Microthlaspi erraticum TaxID=1685480 RepID=A0A6D2JIS5_9BRAS|nr:unnamed protein product [Microthlaspi erraticum]